MYVVVTSAIQNHAFRSRWTRELEVLVGRSAASQLAPNLHKPTIAQGCLQRTNPCDIGRLAAPGNDFIREVRTEVVPQEDDLLV
ncbi:hypothetical protein AaE_015340 [Aphanomyces astaci]|uniref:Uncharacterized protein n=1 Tax=Aphanomyces astaci TaxID=112090 RepID=A0A6A4YXQ4_APHAT|nr:hypothetical protein AaE_015340 [Aphanomyces astaci]